MQKLLAGLLLAALVVLAGCQGPPGARGPEGEAGPQRTTEPATTLAPKTEPTVDPASEESWAFLNDYLKSVYDLPPIGRENRAEDLEELTWALSTFWFGVANESLKRAEDLGIDPHRAAPTCWLAKAWLLADIRLRRETTPFGVVAADMVLAERVKWLMEAVDNLIGEKTMGEGVTEYPTEEDCINAIEANK